MRWSLTALRRLREGRSPLAALFVLVLLTAFIAAAAPRLLERQADRALRAEVASGSVTDRNIQLSQEGRLAAGGPDDAIAPVEDVGQRLADQLPASIASLVTGRTTVIASPRWSAVDGVSTLSTVALRIDPSAATGIRYAAGGPPSGRIQTLPATPSPDGSIPIGAGPTTIYEAALSSETARALGVTVGDRILLKIDPSDRLASGKRADPAGIDVTGIFDVVAPDDPSWFDDPRLLRPTPRFVGANTEYLDATALLDPAAYTTLLTVTERVELPLQYAWRLAVDTSGLRAADVETLHADLRRLEGLYPPSATTDPSAVHLRTGLLRLLEAFEAAWVAVSTVLTVAVIGPIAIAAAAIWLVATFLARGRRPAIEIWRGRGVSALEVALTAAFEGLLVTVPAAAIAAGLAIALLPGGPDTASILAATAVAAAATVLLVVALRAGPAAATRRAREADPVRRVSPRRLALEALVVILAILGAILLRDRGVRGASSTGELASADPFVAAVPVLVGLAVSLVAMRLYPVVMRVAAVGAGARRDLVPSLAFRRAARGGSGGAILLVLLVAVAIGVFSSIALVHLDRAADAVGWQAVGAPFRVTRTVGSGVLPAGLDLATLPSVPAGTVTGVAEAYRSTVSTIPDARTLDLLAIDGPAYEAIVAGTPADPTLPPALLASPASTSTSAALPAIVSSDLASGRDGIPVGGALDVSIGGRAVHLQVVGVRSVFPTMALDEPFVVISLPALQAIHATSPETATDAFLAAPDGAADALRSGLAIADTGSLLASRAAVSDATGSSPAMEAVVTGVLVAAVAAVAYAGLALVIALALAGAARANEVGLLRSLGLTRRGAAGLLVLEHGPIVVVAFLAGVVLGIGLFAILQPGLGLEAIVGTSLEVPIAVDAGHLALLALAVVAVVGLALGLGAALQRAVAPAEAIRRELG